MKTFKLFEDIDQSPAELEQIATKDIQATQTTENTRDRYNPIARQQEVEAQHRAVYKAHQEAIQKAGKLRENITKGIPAGESTYNLLLQAIECISLMTGEGMFLAYNKENLKAIHGIGLQQPDPLQWEFTEVEQRLTLLQRPELLSEPTDTRQRISRAIKANQDRAEQLRKLIDENKQQ